MADEYPDGRDRIAAIPLFEGLPAGHLEELGRIVTERVCDRGQLIFSEGGEATGFYVLAAGRAKVFKLSLDGKEQILHVFGPGEPFGEVAAFEGGRYPANAAALEASRLLFFPRAAFVDLLEQRPDLALKMLAVLAKRLRRFTDLVDDLSLKEVPGRVAAHLLYLRNQGENADQVRLDIAKGQLASLLGTIPETLSRILAKMTQAGLIESTGGRIIRLVDPDGLAALARGDRRL